MDQQLKIDRLAATIEKMKELREEQFNYTFFVSQFEEGKNCGTVCCVAGWYPKWFPESGIYWGQRTINPNDSLLQIKDRLSYFHGLNIEIIKYLFFGDGDSFDTLYTLFLEGPISCVDNRISDVIKQFEFVLKILKEGKI